MLEGMTTWDVWAEGWSQAGDEPSAMKLNRSPIEAETFDAAVLDCIASLTATSVAPGHFYREDSGHWTLWGQRLHPDEKSALGLPPYGTLSGMDDKAQVSDVQRERDEVEAEAMYLIGPMDSEELNVHAYEFPAWT